MRGFKLLSTFAASLQGFILVKKPLHYLSCHDSLIFMLCFCCSSSCSKVYQGTISLHLCQELPLLRAHSCVFHDWARPFEFLSGHPSMKFPQKLLGFHWIQQDPQIPSETSQDLPKLQSCLGVQNMARTATCQGRDQFSVECRALRSEPFNMIQRGTTGIYKRKAGVARLLLFIFGHLWHLIFSRSISFLGCVTIQSSLDFQDALGGLLLQLLWMQLFAIASGSLWQILLCRIQAAQEWPNFWV